jgi:nitrite reductase (NAD(P)H)
MPLLDGPRNGETVTAGVQNAIPVIDGIDPTAHAQESFDHDPNRRQKIVVVGLGMVAVAFMYVRQTEY